MDFVSAQTMKIPGGTELTDVLTLYSNTDKSDSYELIRKYIFMNHLAQEPAIRRLLPYQKSGDKYKCSILSENWKITERIAKAQSIFTDKKGHQVGIPDPEGIHGASGTGTAHLRGHEEERQWQRKPSAPGRRDKKRGFINIDQKRKFSEKTIGYIPVLPVDNTGETAGDPSCIRIIGKSFVKAYIVPVLLLLLLAGLIPRVVLVSERR